MTWNSQDKSISAWNDKQKGVLFEYSLAIGGGSTLSIGNGFTLDIVSTQVFGNTWDYKSKS